MINFHISPANWKMAWWAAGQDFIALRPLDPDFAHMPLLRHLALRFFILPAAYLRSKHARMAHRDRRRLGYLYARPMGRAYFIDSLVVLEAHRRQGIGRALVAQAAQAAQNEDLTLLMGTLAAENTPALNFSTALGAQPWRTRRWLLKTPECLPTPKETWSVQELAPAETLPAYETWQARAIRSGMAWAAEALLEKPFARHDWQGYARHWACRRGAKVHGYLRIAGLGGKYRAYLACPLADLHDEALLHWLHAALRTYSATFQQLQLELPTAAHELAAEKLLTQEQGWQCLSRRRLLMMKRI